MSSLQSYQPSRRFDPAITGYRITYHRESENRCPACGKSHWFVGRISAQCAFCDTSLPFAENGMFAGQTLLAA